MKDPLKEEREAELLDDQGLFRCWCGDLVHFEDLGELEETCGGTGSLNCFCGGDFCVCHNHGEQPCDGCEDCDDPDDSWDHFDDDWETDGDDVWGHGIYGSTEADSFGEGIFD